MSFTDKFSEVFGKVGSQRHLVAVRDSFATLMPVIMAGSAATVINNIPIPQWREFLSKIGLSFLITSNGNIWWGTFSMMTIFITFLLAFNLAKHFGADQILCGIVSLAAYLSIVPQADADLGGWGYIMLKYANATSLLVGMIVAIATAEIFGRLSKIKKLVIKMPDGVPPAVARSFAVVFPGIITIYIIVIVAVVVEMLFKQNVFSIIVNSITNPLAGISDSLPSALAIVFFNHFLWIFGLHGANILEGVIQPLYMPLIEANAAAFNAGEAIPHIVTKQFIDTFVYLGGSGSTLGLLVAIFIVSKAKALRGVGKLAVGPGIFNINEPVIFGLPIVFNIVLGIPFILAPMVLTVISYFALATGIVGRTVVVTHWAMPPILSGILTTGGDLKAAVLQIFNLAVSIGIYLPFVLVADRLEIKKEKELKKA